MLILEKQPAIKTLFSLLVFMLHSSATAQSLDSLNAEVFVYFQQKQSYSTTFSNIYGETPLMTGLGLYIGKNYGLTVGITELKMKGTPISENVIGTNTSNWNQREIDVGLRQHFFPQSILSVFYEMIYKSITLKETIETTSSDLRVLNTSFQEEKGGLGLGIGLRINYKHAIGFLKLQTSSVRIEGATRMNVGGPEVQFGIGVGL